MLCTYCGATTPSTLDRCVVCHTPYPPGFIDSGATVGTDPDDEQTRLTPASQARQPAPPVSAFGTVSGITRLEPGQTFANRYTIIRLLGAGGMAAVYQAWDETLATAVALKLIRVDPSMLPDDIRQLEERFKRELKLARQVTHPNVIRIHDLGEVGRTMYITMAYVQGSDLATVLQRERRLQVPRALSLARQIVSGLSAAHRAGVVHRDLKPANILVDASDQALLTDFGIARSKTGEQAMLTEAGIKHLPASTLHTMPGAIMGTLEYMAPEQVKGEPADERTDIYAVGLIFYELIAGFRPRPTGESIQDLVERIRQGPAPLESVVADMPPEVARIVSKCLKRDPAERYATADDLIADLDQLDAEGNLLPVAKRIPRWKVLTAATVVSAVLIAGTWWIASQQMPLPATARPPLPVLVVDFENRTGEPVFDGALEQPLTVAMEGAPFITAYPRTDAVKLVRQLKQDKLNESAGRLIAYGEGIRVILAGSIERAGRGYRISVRAIDPEKPETPLTVANERAADKAAVFAAIGKAAEDVRKELGDTAPSAQQQAETFTAASLEAIKEYTIAQTLSSSQDDEKAVAHYKAALGHDRNFGRAHAGLAMSLYYLGQRDAAALQWEEALKLKDNMSEREQWRTAGSYYAGPGRNPEKAIEEFTRLVEKYPADRAGQNNLAVAYFAALNFTKALEHGQKALDIYPKSVKFRSNFALYAMYAGDFKKAAETAQALIAEDPTIETAYLPLAMEALASGDFARARRMYEEAAKAGAAGSSLAAIGLADVAIYQGEFDEALAALPDAITRDLVQKDEYGAVAKLLAQADAHGARNQRDRAADALTRARALAQDDRVMVTAGRFAVATGRIDEAKAIATELANRRPIQSRAYGKLIEADIEMAAKRYPAAIDQLNAAQKMMNLWLVRYALGHAYFQLGDYPAALSEFEECQRRRGEATALFLDDLPTFRYYATVPYWLGRVREMRTLDPATQYQEFLAIRGGATDDPLVKDARERLAKRK